MSIKKLSLIHIFVTPVPNSHPNVEGIFMPRDMMITVVDLAKVINAKPSPDIKKDMFIGIKPEEKEAIPGLHLSLIHI